MQTYSHILIAVGLSQPLSYWLASKKINIPKVKTSALTFGSLLPDLALIIIVIGCLIRDSSVGIFNSSAWQNHDYKLPASPELLNASWTASLFDDWFFNNPIVIILQNTFHSPFLLILFIFACYLLWNKKEEKDINKERNKTHNKATYQWLFWVFCAAMLHLSLIHI